MPNLTKQQQRLIEDRLHRAVNSTFHAARDAMRERHKKERDDASIHTELTAEIAAATKRVKAYADCVLQPVLDAMRAAGVTLHSEDGWTVDNPVVVRQKCSVRTAVQTEDLKALQKKQQEEERDLGRKYDKSNREINDIMFNIIVGGDQTVLDQINTAIERLKEIING